MSSQGCAQRNFPDGKTTFVNTRRDIGNAKGGSGDVLTGVIAALTAQGQIRFTPQHTERICKEKRESEPQKKKEYTRCSRVTSQTR